MKRIAILADPLDNQNAGVHVYSREFINALIQQNKSFQYFIFRLKHDPALKGVEQLVVPAKGIPGYMSYRMFIRIPYLIRKLKIDAVVELAHFGPFNLPSRIKRVTVIHDLTPILFPAFHRFHSQLLQKIFLGAILRRAALIITNSQSTTNDIIKVYQIEATQIATLLLGRDPFYYPVATSSELDDLNITKPFFHFVGTIEPRKDLVTLLKAFAIFKSKHNTAVQLLIAGGKGWKSEAFYEALEQHPYRSEIQLLGYVSKEMLRALHTRSKAMIYPSIYEGFGFPVLEALCCNCPVICSDNSSLPEVGGTLANYFETGNSNQLAIQMQKLANEKKSEAFTTQCKQWVETFSWKKYALEFEDAMSKLFNS